MAGWTTLVQPEVLAMALERRDLVIVDCRFSLLDPKQGEQEWLRSRVPGAVYAHLERDLSEIGLAGQGRHPWPTIRPFLDRLRRWGVTPTTQVIVYDGGDGAIASRLWFMLMVMGHEKVALLDGGWTRWTSLGLPVSTSMQQIPGASFISGSFDASRLVDADAVAAHLALGGLLIDARAPERFRGQEEPLDRIAGHVPGAINRPYAMNLENGRFKSPVRLAAEYRELLGGLAPSEVVVMCGSGVTACHNLLAMERAGLKGAKLYAGSWSGWISDPTRPVVTGS
ncbi:MAG: sulfurtransferase [Thermomonas sp.]|uniref:sulfurtransferase n=1 Tax=Thermomonas sp. TaxID=1971895 RepID=UPI00262E5F43|nr:sulfurtransferase [Thermomonas sp.]MCC7095709.1 sulfurtransferase [Thermomonas sp.]